MKIYISLIFLYIFLNSDKVLSSYLKDKPQTIILSSQNYPASDRLYEVLRPLAKSIYIDQEEYKSIFVLFEYLYALRYFEHNSSAIYGYYRKYMLNHYAQDQNPIDLLEDEIKTHGNDHKFFQAGFFERKSENYFKIRNKFEGILRSLIH